MPSFWGCRCCGVDPDDLVVSAGPGEVHVMRQSNLSTYWKATFDSTRTVFYELGENGSLTVWTLVYAYNAETASYGPADHRRSKYKKTPLYENVSDDYGASEIGSFNYPIYSLPFPSSRGGRHFVLQDQVYGIDAAESVTVFDVGGLSGTPQPYNHGFAGCPDGGLWVVTDRFTPRPTTGYYARIKARKFNDIGSLSAEYDVDPPGTADEIIPLGSYVTDQDGTLYFVGLANRTSFCICKVTDGGTVSFFGGLTATLLCYSEYHDGLVITNHYGVGGTTLSIVDKSTGTLLPGTASYTFGGDRGRFLCASRKQGNIFLAAQNYFSENYAIHKIDSSGLYTGVSRGMSGYPCCVQS